VTKRPPRYNLSHYTTPIPESDIANLSGDCGMISISSKQ